MPTPAPLVITLLAAVRMSMSPPLLTASMPTALPEAWMVPPMPPVVSPMSIVPAPEVRTARMAAERPVALPTVPVPSESLIQMSPVEPIFRVCVPLAESM